MAWTTALLLVLGIAAYGVAGDSFLTPLANYVKSHSDPDVAPQQSADKAVDVHFNYAIGNIADVDKEHNTITVETYVRSNWQTGVQWDPKEYGGADMITLPRKYFWTPRMHPIHTAVEMEDLSPQMVHLKSDGTAYYNQFYRMQSLCDVSDVANEAKCGSKTSLWGYSMDQVNVASFGGDQVGAVPYFAGSKYEITGLSMVNHEITFDNKKYHIMDTELSIKEKPQADQGQVSLSFNFH